MSKSTPDTVYAAAVKLLACWSRMHPRDRPMWLVNEITALGDSINREAVQRSSQVNRETVGRNPHPSRAEIERLLQLGQPGKAIAQATAASLRTVQTVRDEMRAAGQLPSRTRAKRRNKPDE